MKRTLKWLKRGLLTILGLLGILTGAGLIYREIMQSHAEARLAITEPIGIDEDLYASIGGREQWISIRGRDRNNPVMLMLHGGPGNGNGPMLAQLMPLEQRYTLVQWDQPGTGRTFRRAGYVLPADLTIEDIVQDGIEVAERVRSRLDVDRLILLGWSWGSVIGVEMARRRPDLVAAYVGTGQLTSVQTNEAAVYAMTLAKARRLGDSAAESELVRVGAPPYDSLAEFRAARIVAARLGSQPSLLEALSWLLLAPRYSLVDDVSYIRGFLASGRHFIGAALDGPVFRVDLPTTAPAFEVPVVFIQGDEDEITPARLARGYFDRLTAPRKNYVAIEGGHMLPIDQTDAFLAALDKHVRPLTMNAPTTQ
jgi:proline iminopeptidase